MASIVINIADNVVIAHVVVVVVVVVFVFFVSGKKDQ
jgi:hypothetical protein